MSEWEDSSCNAWALTLFLAWRVWVLKLELWGDAKIHVSCTLELCLRPIHLFSSQYDKHSNIQKWHKELTNIQTNLAKTWISRNISPVTGPFPHLLKFHLQLLAPLTQGLNGLAKLFQHTLVVGLNPFKKILTTLDHLPRLEKNKNIRKHHLVTSSWLIDINSVWSSQWSGN